MKKKVNYNEGDIFMFPIDKDKYSIGLITRKNRKILLGYFWNLVISDVNELDINNICDNKIIWIQQFSALGIENGEWEIVGRLPNFLKEDWAIPKFLKVTSSDPTQKMLVYYDEKLKVIKEELLTETIESNLPEDGLAGYGFVEKKISKILLTSQLGVE